MTSQAQVRQYLAFWFQLGKPLVISKKQLTVLPQPIIVGDRYSPEFEECWQQVMALEGRDCYLEGTIQTVAELLAPTWDMVLCARCDMPVPMVILGQQDPGCPCDDLPTWPNDQLPQPRQPVDSRAYLENLRGRLSRSLKRP
jgi:hypothetical protein